VSRLKEFAQDYLLWREYRDTFGWCSNGNDALVAVISEDCPPAMRTA
jgi:hypothetical protein